MLSFISCLSRTLQILRQCCLEMRGHDQKHGIYLYSRNNLKEASTEWQRETGIYILGPALRQHMQELSWSCLTGFLPIKLGFNRRSTCISSFLKRFGATVCCESLPRCQTGCCKQIQIFPWKKSCLVHFVSLSFVHVLLTLSLQHCSVHTWSLPLHLHMVTLYEGHSAEQVLSSALQWDSGGK